MSVEIVFPEADMDLQNNTDSKNVYQKCKEGVPDNVLDVSYMSVDINSQDDSQMPDFMDTTPGSNVLLNTDDLSDVGTLPTLRPKRLFKGNLKEINVSRKTHMTPRKTLLYNSNKRYKQRTYVLNQRYAIAKQRIKEAEEYMYRHNKSFNRLNSFSAKFFESNAYAATETSG